MIQSQQMLVLMSSPILVQVSTQCHLVQVQIILLLRELIMLQFMQEMAMTPSQWQLI